MSLPAPLDVQKAKELIGQDTIVLDTRSASAFTQSFIPGSVFFGLQGRSAEWPGDLLDYQSRILLVTDPGREEESFKLLSKLGFANIEGFLQGGIEAWLEAGEPSDMIIDIEPDELIMDMPHDPNLLVIDVRQQPEYEAGHLADAINIPLDEMGDVAAFAGLEERQNLYIHCSSGYRSAMASSILKKHGFHNLRNIPGGWDRIKEEKGVRIEKENNALN